MYSHPAKSVNEYLSFREDNIRFQKGLQKMGLEHSMQDSSGMDDTSYHAMVQERKLNALLHQYTIQAEAKFGRN